MCLEKLHKIKKLDKCAVCKSKYRIAEPIYRTLSGIRIKHEIDNTLYFPYNDLYYQPLMSNSSLTKFTGMSRLTMAIVYLQVERVAELLKEQEVLDGLGNYFFGYEGYKQTPIIALCTGNLYSNASINMGVNAVKYIQIMKMLLDTGKIDLSAKDEFGKTAMMYANELSELPRLLIITLLKKYGY
jgi:hypothetical protein